MPARSSLKPTRYAAQNKTAQPALPQKPRARKVKFDPARIIQRPVGRPSSYSEEAATHIAEQMTLGRHLLDICDHDPIAPDRVTVYRWMGELPEFATRIAQARVAQADHSEKMIESTVETTTPANANGHRVKLLGYQWLASRRNPALYGEKTQANVNVSIGLEGFVSAIQERVAKPVEAVVERVGKDDAMPETQDMVPVRK